MLKPLTLNTKRLILKTLTPEESHIVLDFYQKNTTFLKPWEPVREEDFFSLEYHQRALEADVRMMLEGYSIRFWLFERDSENETIVGTVALSNIVRGCFLSCHLGYKLDGAKIGQGYMKESLQQVIKYAFETLKLHRIEANIMPRNLKSMKVVEGLGFHKEGCAKKYLKINGQWEDHVHMVLLNDRV